MADILFFCREQSENQFTAMPKKENKIKANKQHAQAFNGGQQRGKIASDGDEKKKIEGRTSHVRANSAANRIGIKWGKAEIIRRGKWQMSQVL